MAAVVAAGGGDAAPAASSSGSGSGSGGSGAAVAGVKRSAAAAAVGVAARSGSGGGGGDGSGSAAASVAAEEEEGRRSRVRRAPARFDDDAAERESEAVAIRIALGRSRRMTGMKPAAAAVPSEEEWADPCAYIASIRPSAERYGICKVVPPAGWNPPCTLEARMASSVKYKTRLQALHTLTEGQPFPDGRLFTFAEYRAMANEFKATHFPQFIATKATPPASAAVPPDASPYARQAPAVEAAYWGIVERADPPTFVEYGNDQDTSEVGSGFPLRIPADAAGDGDDGAAGAGAGAGADAAAPPQRARLQKVLDVPARLPPRWDDPEYYRQCGWNLNNLPFLPQSVLRYLDEEINGVTVPWLYLGMLFSTFAWHNEDHFMYSLNYMHAGEGKTWYGIAGLMAPDFEKAIRSIMYERAKEDHDLIYQVRRNDAKAACRTDLCTCPPTKSPRPHPRPPPPAPRS